MAPKLAIVTQHFYSLRFGGVGPALEEYSKIGSIHLFWTNLRCPRVQNTKESVQIKKGKPMNCALSKCSVDGLCVVRSRCFCLFRWWRWAWSEWSRAQRIAKIAKSLYFEPINTVWCPNSRFVSSWCWWSRHRRTDFKTTTAANAYQQPCSIRNTTERWSA